jgi:peptide/nickel transport system ATP-binding protein/oligopeptide transport system ATP-binding protein
MTVGELIGEPLALHDIVPASRRRDRVAELLSLSVSTRDMVNVTRMNSPAASGSGIAIARALAVEPKLVVCDEPVSALDVSIRSQVLNLLATFASALALTYVFISHDLSVVKHIADRVAVMYLGRIVETQSADELFASPRHPYTRALFSAIPLPAAALAAGNGSCWRAMFPVPLSPPHGCHLHPRCAYAIDRCRIERPRLLADQVDTRPPAIVGASCPPCRAWPEQQGAWCPARTADVGIRP